MDKENIIGKVSGVETFPLKTTPTESTKGSLLERKAPNNAAEKEIKKEAMDAFVTARPPRGRRQSQSFADIETSNPATIHTLHHSCNKALSHRHRSSSQPRPSRTVEPLPPSQMNTSTRSMSQPRSSQNTHFLDGFNVADCFDVRTIPDPPSPSSSRKRHRRRVSSAVLRPMSSMDVDNRGNHQVAVSNNANDSEKKSSFVTRRKRKTLSHVPAPLYAGGEERCDVEVRPNHSQINFCRDEGDDEFTKLSAKRKKKRQSIVIPRDLPLEVGHSSAYTSPRDVPNESIVASKSSPKVKKEFVPLDFKSMQQLRSLVRGYCSLSSDDKTGSSEAKEIFSMTGYALPKKANINDDGNKSESVLANRRLVIKKIAPVLQQMESRKKRDVKNWEEKTQCRVSKSERSGRFKYHDIQTNQKVGSQEYKRRYIAVLEHERPSRELRARQWMGELNHQASAHYAVEEPQHFDCPNSVCMDHEEQEHLDVAEMQQKEAFLPPRSPNLVRNRSMSDRDVVTIECNPMRGERQSDLLLDASTRDEMTEIADIAAVSSEDTDDNSRESVSPKPDASNDALAKPEQEEHFNDKSPSNDVVGNDVTENIPLLPLPSKDSESMDPEIAAAEKRLWDKIDLALHEYSGEVMMIQRKRRKLAEAHPGPNLNQNGEGK